MFESRNFQFSHVKNSLMRSAICHFDMPSVSQYYIKKTTPVKERIQGRPSTSGYQKSLWKSIKEKVYADDDSDSD